MNEIENEEKGENPEVAEKKIEKKRPEQNCLARMMAKVTSEGEVIVKYLKSHNHESKSKEKNSRESTVTVPDKTVGDEMDNFCDNYEPLQDLVTSTSEYEDDYNILKCKVEELQTDSFSPILIYKPAEELTQIGPKSTDDDLFLFLIGIQTKVQFHMMENGIKHILCIDCTHFDSVFYLVNFIVPDEFDLGYPVAHFITNRYDVKVFQAMVESISTRFQEHNLEWKINCLKLFFKH